MQDERGLFESPTTRELDREFLNQGCDRECATPNAGQRGQRSRSDGEGPARDILATLGSDATTARKRAVAAQRLDRTRKDTANAHRIDRHMRGRRGTEAGVFDTFNRFEGPR